MALRKKVNSKKPAKPPTKADSRPAAKRAKAGDKKAKAPAKPSKPAAAKSRAIKRSGTATPNASPKPAPKASPKPSSKASSKPSAKPTTHSTSGSAKKAARKKGSKSKTLSAVPKPAKRAVKATPTARASQTSALLRSAVPARISSQELAIELARLAHDDKCTDIVVLDVRGLSPISDFVIVASGTSDRQMRAVADHAEDEGAKHGHHAYRSSKDPRALWLLIDFSDVVIHIFEPNTRAHYDIEMMWGDAKRVPWKRAESKKSLSKSRARAAST